MSEFRVSVIINTYNRAHHLKRVLDCLARQIYDEFEVIVVNGPSTDKTDEILNFYTDAIRIENCPEVNLSVSRNIGIAAAAGEIVVFIDDDAVPGDRMWLENLCHPFQDSQVAAAGGQVFRMDGIQEFSCGVFNKYGENDPTNENGYEQDIKTGNAINGVMGCNCAFRRSVLASLGGFDEFYTYFLEETDLCYRIAKNGYKVVHADDAIVRHEAANGVNRQAEYKYNWKALARSRTYFVMKTTRDYGFGKDESSNLAEGSCYHWKKEFDRMKKERIISEEEFQLYRSELDAGITEGISAGLTKRRKLRLDLRRSTGLFKKFDKTVGKNHMNICYFCKNDTIHPEDEMSKMTNTLANEMKEMGHNIYIISSGEKEFISNIGGINYCFVVPEHIPVKEIEELPLSREALDFSYACYRKLEEIKSGFQIDIIDMTLMDSCGLVTCYFERGIPVITRLLKPLGIKRNNFSKDFKILKEFESAMLLFLDLICLDNNHISGLNSSNFITYNLKDPTAMNEIEMIYRNIIQNTVN